MGGFDAGIVLASLPYLLTGFSYSVQLTGTAFAGGIVLGTLLAVARLSPRRWLSLPARLYVDLMRSIPLVLVLFWFYFMVPLLLQAVTGASRPVPVGPERSAIITFIAFEAAYFCEIVRAGVRAVGQGQMGAALSLGLSRAQAYMWIILPQAFRTMTPVLLTQLIILFQDTSLVYVLSVTDLLGAASRIAQRDGALVEMYVTVAVVYFVISFSLSRWVALIQRRTAIVR